MWWKFAYDSIIETEIKRRKRNWSWYHMREHRNLCRSYAEAYRAKLTARKISNDIQQRVDLHEEKLDLFNLMLIRNRVDLEVEKSGIKQQQESTKSSWFGGWWYGSKSSNDENTDKDIREYWKFACFSLNRITKLLISFAVDQFKTAMTSEEKEKLYQAIGYHEEGVDLQLPEDYVAITAHFQLKLLEVCVRNEIASSPDVNASNDLQTILSLQVSNVSCELDQRPSASGLKVDLNMKEFTVFGFKQRDLVPVMVKSILSPSTDSSLLKINFEMNPLDKKCDQRVDVSARPLQIVYDAETIIQLLQVFQMPKDANLTE